MANISRTPDAYQIIQNGSLRDWNYSDVGSQELVVSKGSNITRVLYFFYFKKQIILTNGFIKKTQKTPSEEIKLAKQRRSDYLRRMNKS